MHESGQREDQMAYPKERKEAVLKKMLPPNNKTIPVIGSSIN